MADSLTFNGLPKQPVGAIARDSIQRPRALRLKAPRPMAAESTVVNSSNNRTGTRARG